MKSNSFLFTALLCLALATSLPLKAQSQQEMNRTAAEEAEKADVELNKVYKKVLEFQSDDEAKTLLKAAQKAWIAFRDAEAKHAGDEARGGSLSPLLYSGAITRVTVARTKQLQEKLAEEPSEIPILLPEGGKTAKAACEAFFKAYAKHDRKTASTVAGERALSKVNWDPAAGAGAKLKFEGDDIIIYEGGHLKLLTKQNSHGIWFVVDVESTAD